MSWQNFGNKVLIKPNRAYAQHLEDDKATETYEEIQPFMDKIHSQHKALKEKLKNATGIYGKRIS